MTQHSQFLTLLLLFVFSLSFSQQDTVTLNSVRKFQHELNAEYKDPSTSPLDSEKLKKFTGHDFFPVDLAYQVEAVLTVTDKEPYFNMMTSSNKTKSFRQYGILELKINGKTFQLPVYQSQKLIGSEGFADYLFFPFTDLTNGTTSYSAGRYIDLRIPENGNILIVDFNKAYNPLCAYSDRYSCPLVPERNHIQAEIQAGVRYTATH